MDSDGFSFVVENVTIDKIPFELSENDVLPKPHAPEVRKTFVVLYILIIICAAIGNGTVIVVTFLSRVSSTVTDLYIASLAVADLLISLLNMPFQLNFFITNEWKMGLFLCKFSNYIQGVVVTASILTLTVIAVDRYLVICRPRLSREIHTKKVATIAILSMWVISLLCMCPQLMAQQLDMVLVLDFDTHIPTGMAQLCREHFDRPEVATIVIYALVYILPLLIMTLSYGAIAHRLWIQHPIGDMLENPRNHERSMKQKKKVILMLMLLVYAFAILWLPFFTATLVKQYVETGESFRTYEAILQLIGYTNCCVNPIIYAFLNKTFQRQFKSLCVRRQLPRIIQFRPASQNRTVNTLGSQETREPGNCPASAGTPARQQQICIISKNCEI